MAGYAASIGSAEIQQEHVWELATEISHITYKEPGVMREKGVMYGIAGSYTYRKNFMLKADGRFSYGWVDYRNSGAMDNIDDYMLEFRGLGGYGFSVLKASALTPYMGIGYRYLNDDMSGRTTSTGAWGYEREISYIYSPIGIEMITSLKNGKSIGATLEYDYFWDGTVKSHLSDVPGYYDIENDQNKGYGFRGSIKLEKKGEKINFVIAPFIRYWKIKDSETTTDPAGRTWIEPKNHSTEIGIKFALEF